MLCTRCAVYARVTRLGWHPLVHARRPRRPPNPTCTSGPTLRPARTPPPPRARDDSPPAPSRDTLARRTSIRPVSARAAPTPRCCTLAMGSREVQQSRPDAGRGASIVQLACQARVATQAQAAADCEHLRADRGAQEQAVQMQASECGSEGGERDGKKATGECTDYRACTTGPLSTAQTIATTAGRTWVHAMRAEGCLERSPAWPTKWRIVSRATAHVTQ